jgi:hypothetical protein
MDRYRWTLRQKLLRHSLAEIATDEHFGRATISEGIKRFVGLLPDSWGTVFGGQNAGKQLDQLLPIPQLKAAKALDTDQD